jgi:hypothetical protein
MPVLLYAVTEKSSLAIDLPPGAGGATVQRMECCGLTCFYSENSIMDRANTRETALQFHDVVNSIFQKLDLIPFRFPTLLADCAEITSEIEKRAASYHTGLEKIRGHVQMEIRIQSRGSRQEDTTQGAATSGAEYLRARQNRHINLKTASSALQAAAAAVIELWHEREYSDSLRCFALVPRGSVDDFQQALAGAAIPSDLLARVSGPWPATEFLERGADGEA